MGNRTLNILLTFGLIFAGAKLSSDIWNSRDKIKEVLSFSPQCDTEKVQGCIKRLAGDIEQAGTFGRLYLDINDDMYYDARYESPIKLGDCGCTITRQSLQELKDVFKTSHSQGDTYVVRLDKTGRYKATYYNKQPAQGRSQ